MTASLARRLDSIFSFATRLTSERSSEVLDHAVDAVVNATAARACLAFGVDGARDAVAERGVLARAGVNRSVIERALYRLASRAATTRRALVIADTRTAQDLPDCSELARAGIAAVLLEPVLHQRSVLAVMAAVYDHPGLLDEGAAQHTATIAHLSALALKGERNESSVLRERGPAAGGVALVTATMAQELDAPASALVLQQEALRQLVDQVALHADSGSSELAQAAHELDELVQEIGVAIARLRKTTDRLMSFGRSESAFEKLDLCEVARGAVESARNQFTARGVMLEEQFGPDSVTLGRNADLEQVVRNLLMNAAEAAATSRDPHVLLKVHSDSRHVWLVVEDNGPGVPPDQVQNLFQPFFTTKTHAQGAGLGLPVAREVVGVHGGHIEVHARYGGGASFRVVLPRASAAAPEHAHAPAKPAAPAGVRQVLVVDDDAMFPRTLRRGLKPHQVRTAASASEAEMILLDPAYEPDLIVCDMHLPGAHGDVLHQRILARRPELSSRFVFVSGAALGKEEADYLKSSGCLTLLEPVEVESLRALLEARQRAESTPPKSVRTLADTPESERATLVPPERR